MRLRKLFVLLHRWLGVFFCLLFAMWFLSGIVMMYWSYPEVTMADRLARAEELEVSNIRVSAAQAAEQLGERTRPNQASLEMFDGRPAYRFRIGRAQKLVYADTGEPIGELSTEAARKIAAKWTGRPEREERFEGTIDTEDQWTVSGAFRALRPLLKFSWPNGDEVYVSPATAQVEQHTTRADRIAAYFGAIPHWMYFTPLRKNGPLWSRVVIWASGIATVAAILGEIVALWISLPAKRIPYAGMKRWHTLFGLCFGAIASTWAFSGMLSMEPFPIEGDDDVGPAIAKTLRGARFDLAAFGAKTPRQALEQMGSAIRVKQLEFGMFAGEPVYTARESPDKLRIVPVNGDPMAEFDRRRILDLVANAAAPTAIAETRVVTQYEAYYLDRERRRPLPVLFVRLKDPQSSMYYIDPRTARIVESYGSGGRWNRWLYHGFHSIDLPWLYAHRPAWDIVVLALLLGGSALCITSVILAGRFLRRTLR
ncbi:MAG: PepSY domain-containing protein [Bryobacterales bacterium]|nr:PepSY domain-containing protein [Bryobacterales bacterium]